MWLMVSFIEGFLLQFTLCGHLHNHIMVSFYFICEKKITGYCFNASEFVALVFKIENVAAQQLKLREDIAE